MSIQSIRRVGSFKTYLSKDVYIYIYIEIEIETVISHRKKVGSFRLQVSFIGGILKV